MELRREEGEKERNPPSLYNSKSFLASWVVKRNGGRYRWPFVVG
jgi:hypothetical protein